VGALALRSGTVTGGTYSVYRATYGVFLAVVLVRVALAPVGDPITLGAAILGALATIPFLVGFRDRWAALVLAPAVLITGLDAPSIVIPLIMVVPLAVHVGLRSAPYGSLDARGRPDPAGDFAFPPAVSFGLYALLAGAYAALALPAVRAPLPTPTDWGFAACAAVFLVLGLSKKMRFTGWVIMLGALVGRLVVAGDPLATPLLFVHLLAFDATAIGPRPGVRGERVFYDGACGLCHRAVRFVLAEDVTGEAFRFAALGGEAFEAEVPEAQKGSLPDSIVLVTHDAEVLVRSNAILRMMDGLGGLWRVLATLLRLIPRPLRDLGYDGVAAVRHRIFAKPADVCPIIPKHLRPRFDP